ncbi:MAG: hypothetical protein JST21_02695 [Bacteroidetes bacterium]|nr:hypothetical protein [Bacteroidota bacterium]
MHDSNHNDDFERYLQDQVNEHRMYPSDHVWKNIRSKVHTQKKWPALSVFTVLVISALVVGTILNKPVPDPIAGGSSYTAKTTMNNQIPDQRHSTKSTVLPVDNNSIDQLTSKTIVAAVEKIKIDEAISKQLITIAALPFEKETTISSSVIAASNNYNSIIAAQSNLKKNNAHEVPTEIVTNNSESLSFKNIDNYLFNVTSRLRSILNSDPSHFSGSGGVAFFNSGHNINLFNAFDLNVPTSYKDPLPSLDKLGNSSGRFDFRFYVTPSISYRNLKENSKDDNKNAGAALSSGYHIDPSKAINQTPAIGYETGIGLGYKLSNRLTLTGGFQFNVSRYKINAFLYKDEPVAVTLNNGEFSSTISAVSNLRSVTGNKPLTFKNSYYQISLPLGAEWQILNSGRFTWGVGASIQPTYTFDKQPLIISSNFKNYADGSAYVRNWNINANAETFFGYTTGSYRWQIGPQFRYQMLPSLVDRYPNREYLLNYGLKIGVVKQLK